MLDINNFVEIALRFGIKWKNPTTGLVLGLAAGAPTFSALLLSERVTLSSTILISLACALGAVAFWWLTCRIPRSKRGKIGIALAIQYETLDERRRIKADFVEQVVSRLACSDAGNEFHVYEVPDYLSPDANDISGAAKFFRRSRCHLLIWGNLRTRKQGNSPRYCLRLEGAVTHAIIQIEQSKALAQDVRLAIPKQTEIDFANELRGFENTSVDVSDGAQFVVALAAAVSQDWAFSRRLLDDLNRRSGTKPFGRPSRSRKARHTKTFPVSWRSLVAPRLASVCFAQFHVQLARWQEDKSDLKVLAAAEEALEAFRRATNQPEATAYLINKALLDVTLRKDFSSAERLLNRCRATAIDDPTWRLSLAFVHAVTDRLATALELYDAALERNIPAATLMDVENYVHWWLELNQGPATLYLLSAELNAKGKRDWVLARADLEYFVESGVLQKRPDLSTRVNSLRDELVTSAAEASVSAKLDARPRTVMGSALSSCLPDTT